MGREGHFKNILCMYFIKLEEVYVCMFRVSLCIQMIFCRTDNAIVRLNHIQIPGFILFIML